MSEVEEEFVVNGIKWKSAYPKGMGYIPHFLDSKSTQTVEEQINFNYAHGGGWRPMNGFKLNSGNSNPLLWNLRYPGDPIFRAIGYCYPKPDVIFVVFSHAWCMIMNTKTGEKEIARMD